MRSARSLNSDRPVIADKRAAILRAAIRVFAHNGYFNSKVADIREKLRRIALLHLERLGDDRDLAVVFQVELRGSTKFMEEFSAAGFAEYLGLIRSTFEEGQRAGVFRSELNAKVVAKILFGALDEMATNWILSKRRYKLAPMADQVLDIFLNGVAMK